MVKLFNLTDAEAQLIADTMEKFVECFDAENYFIVFSYPMFVSWREDFEVVKTKTSLMKKRLILRRLYKGILACFAGLEEYPEVYVIWSEQGNKTMLRLSPEQLLDIETNGELTINKYLDMAQIVQE